MTQITEIEEITANLIYGVKRFVPPIYTEYKIKRDGIFGKKKLVKIADNVLWPRCFPEVDLAVSDNGCLLGIPEAIEMYNAEI